MQPDDIFREFDRLFAELSLTLTPHARRGSFNPNADVFLTENGQTVVVTVELASVDPQHVKLVVEGASLYLAGYREPHLRHADAVLQKEIDYGCFLKRIQLPFAVAVNAARAEYHDGTLTIKLPAAQARRGVVADRAEIRTVVRSRG
jgi:HSP20 family protein